jgi:UDP-N-acetylmuramoylalanine--D-glutamate ligase
MNMRTKQPEVRGRSALILGYGREGKSIHAWLKKHYPKLRIAVTDQKDGTEYLSHIAEYDTVVRSPGVPPYLLGRARHITSATNIFFSRVQGKTIGITGTKGKSTTASLIAHILRVVYPDVRLVGNIGNPMLDALSGSSKNTVFVIELSSHQLVDIRYSPKIAVLLEIVPEHLDYYPDFASYKRAKENIFRFQKPGDHLVRGETLDAVYKTTLLGNRENIAAAVKVARFMNVPEQVIQKQLATFSPLPHRLEFVGEHRGVRFYNDSLATIPEATIHALEALGGKVVTLIAGGYDRGLDYSALGSYLGHSSVNTLILFPDTGKKIARVVKTKIHTYAVGSMEEAVRLAYEHTPKGKICLLSPASASYNMFRDYEDRGNQFKEWVKKFGSLS